ncbi:MAG: DUF2723 domain-containing protein [Sandaracinaceae bacterium]
MKRALGLPVDSPRTVWASFGLLLGVYVLTMARDLTFYDGPELALVAHQLGVGHPAGQPLHTMLGWPFAHVPGVSPLVGLSFLSALFGAACIVPAWAIADHIAPESRRRPERLMRFAVLTGIGLSTLAWEPATRVEVYTLASFLGLFAVAWSLTRESTWVAGLFAGLAGGAHMVIGAGQGLAALVLSRRPRAAAGALLAGLLAGVACYFYVPLAAGDPARFAWGAPTDATSLLGYVRGADYIENQGITLAGWLSHLGRLAVWGLESATLPVSAIGFVALFARARRLGLAVLFATVIQVGFVAANVVFHPDVPDYRGYFLSPFWLCGAGLAAATQWIARRGETLEQRRRHLAYAGLAAALPLAALLAAPHHLSGPRERPSLARALAEGALDELPEGALVIVESDHWVAPLWYVQEVEGQRPDVVIVAYGLASSRWYWEHLYALHPDLRHIPLAGPGGREGRLRRFGAAHPERTLWVESTSVASRLGAPVCRVGHLLETEPCRSRVASETASVALRGNWTGTSREVVARVGAHRGEALWRLGAGREAARALHAGIESIAPRLPERLSLRVTPLTGPVPAIERPPRALHDPAQNLTMLAFLLRAMGASEADAFAARATTLPP